ncbi:hypothetical protein GCM10009127_29020 [Alteraurantiacibacter aestuarii]|uniref:Glycosyltransferase RgtA/B/C/D-like domain-containing protein n=1 Tax=Alteraurantiacibacter aestuarii TaxID=650004 RepID=A0A844ZNU4_9SPHN|nr:hypothetical protein [Alteraurantiacibacter aestuarii]MXO89012.1 hypothetical protein [Alteraurantiacibacter aestuarii]
MYRSDPWHKLALAIVLAAAVAFSAAAIMARGPWYDEFYTLYAADPGLGFADALVQRWLPDNHPPLYYALSWASGWLGEAVEARRFINLGILLMAAFALFLLGQWRPEFRRVGLLYAIALVSLDPAVLQVAQLRSNFLAYASAAVLVAALTVIANPASPKPVRRDWTFLGIALAIAFNVHLTATVICAAVGAAFGVWILLRRDWPQSIGLVITGLIAALPFIILIAMQFGRMEENTRVFWIPGGFDAARWALENELVGWAGDNIALTVVGAMGIGYLVQAAVRERQLPPEFQLVLALAAGAALATTILLAVHMWRPIILGRYLVALAPLIAMILAVGASVILGRVNALLRLAAIATMLMIMGLSLSQKLDMVRALPSWNGTAGRIAEISRQCPDTIVHPALDWNRPTMDLPPADNRRVMPMAYRLMAQRHDFSVEDEASRRMSADCPTVFWAEHVAGQQDGQAEITARLLQQGYPVGETRFEQIGDGWILLSNAPGMLP